MNNFDFKCFPELISYFKAINMLDLFENFLSAQISYDTEGFAVAAADVVGANQNDAIAYVDGSNSQLSYPLDCVKDIIDMSVSRVQSAYNETIAAAKNA